MYNKPILGNFFMFMLTSTEILEKSDMELIDWCLPRIAQSVGKGHSYLYSRYFGLLNTMYSGSEFVHVRHFSGGFLGYLQKRDHGWQFFWVETVRYLLKKKRLPPTWRLTVKSKIWVDETSSLFLIWIQKAKGGGTLNFWNMEHYSRWGSWTRNMCLFLLKFFYSYFGGCF